MGWYDSCDFSELLGKTLTKIERIGDERIIFYSGDDAWDMYHFQDCCETVEIAEIIGELDDLVGSPILLAEMVEGGANECPEGVSPPKYPDSFTWTFYKLRGLHADVTIRWLGESNGYYSESVNFERVNKDR